MVVGGPAAVVFLLGTPELALPSEWADARARIDDGSFPAGYIVDLVSGVLALAWAGGLWFLLTGVLKQDETTHDESTHDESTHDESTHDETDIPITGASSEPDEPWYRQGPPIFDEPFSDEYPRVVVPPDDMIPDDGPQDSVWQPATMTAEPDEPLGMLLPDVTAEDMVSDAEIIGDVGGSDPDEHPMIVPVRAYYFTRAEDTLRSISAQFLNTPRRWQELRSLNAASPGVAAAGPDTLLPVGTALALPGDPLPWGKPDPVYLWTLAEKFLFTAWGREPTPEEVVPFWRGLTSGTQLEAGAPSQTGASDRARAHRTEPPHPRSPANPHLAQPPLPGDFQSPPPPVSRMEPPPAPAAFQPPPPSHPTRIRTPCTTHTRTTRTTHIRTSPFQPPVTPARIPHTHPQHTNQPPSNHQSPRTHTNPPHPQHTNHPHPHTNPPYPQHTNHPHPHTNPPHPQHTNHPHPIPARIPITRTPNTRTSRLPTTSHPARIPIPPSRPQPPPTTNHPHPHTNPPYPRHTNHPRTSNHPHPRMSPPYPQPTHHPHPRMSPPYPRHTNHPRTSNHPHPHTNPPYPQPTHHPHPRMSPP